MFLPRFISRRLRALGFLSLGLAIWRNRRDVERWIAFARRSFQSREATTFASMVTEAKVRAAMSADPVLRHDPAIDDVTVRDGVVTLHTTTPAWPDREQHAARLRAVNGVFEVICVGVPAATTATATATA
jgi:hypothetical protein